MSKIQDGSYEFYFVDEASTCSEYCGLEIMNICDVINLMLAVAPSGREVCEGLGYNHGCTGADRSTNE